LNDTRKYNHVSLSDDMLETARTYLREKNFENTKRLSNNLDTSRAKAAAVFYRLGWDKWAKNHPNGTTFTRGKVSE